MCEKRRSITVKLRGKDVRLDPCLKTKVLALNRRGILTVGSCCGHGVYPETIICRTRSGRIYELNTRTTLPRTRNFYLMDPNGFYFIPEISP